MKFGFSHPYDIPDFSLYRKKIISDYCLLSTGEYLNNLGWNRDVPK